MNLSEKRLWGIHTRDDDLFLNEGIIAIGGGEVEVLFSIAPD